MARKSRLNKNFQKKSRNTFIISILGIIIILFLLLRYGIPLLSDASYLFGKITSNSNDSINAESDENIFVPIPRLDSIPTFTNKELLIVSGSSLPDLTIEFHLNGNLVEAVETDSSGSFQHNMTLTEGSNIVKVRAVKNNAKSEFSRSYNIELKAEGPDLSIDKPKNGDEVKEKNPVEIRGSSEPGSKVTVNGFQAILNSDGQWSYFLTLVDGDNELIIISIDPAGNETKETIQVKYSP